MCVPALTRENYVDSPYEISELCQCEEESLKGVIKYSRCAVDEFRFSVSKLVCSLPDILIFIPRKD